MNAPLLALHEVSRHYHTQAGVVRALDRVSLDIAPGETLGLVGESGCGKSTVARVAMRLTDVDEGEVRLDGEDIATAHGRALQAGRPRVQMVFQDPAGSLNPRATIGQTLEAPLIVHRRGNAGDRQSRVANMRTCCAASACIPIWPAAIPTNYPADSGSVWTSPVR